MVLTITRQFLCLGAVGPIFQLHSLKAQNGPLKLIGVGAFRVNLVTLTVNVKHLKYPVFLASIAPWKRKIIQNGENEVGLSETLPFAA